MSARTSIPITASAEAGIARTTDRLSEDRLTRPGGGLATSAKAALNRLAPSANSSPDLSELARELGRLAAQAEMRRARRGSVAVLNHWIVALLGIILALVAIWTVIEK